MKEEQRQLEAQGYTFEVKEEPITEPGSKLDVYYRVAIKHHGLVLGTRSEISRERAMGRALQFAKKHSRGEEPRSLMTS